MLALLAAMKEEISDIRERMLIEESLQESGCRAYMGKYRSKSIMLVQTGIGKERAEAATRLVLDRYPAVTLVSMGIAGALTDGLRAGDVFICTELGCSVQREQPGTAAECVYSDNGLVALASQALTDKKIRFVRGKSISALEVVIDPGSKQSLGSIHEAGVVDMESFWVARIAAERCVPFLGIRVISDTSQDRIPDFGRFTRANGSLKAKEACFYFAKHPAHFIYMMRMSRNVARAKGNLRLVLDSFIDRVSIEPMAAKH